MKPNSIKNPLTRQPIIVPPPVRGAAAGRGGSLNPDGQPKANVAAIRNTLTRQPR